MSNGKNYLFSLQKISAIIMIYRRNSYRREKYEDNETKKEI